MQSTRADILLEISAVMNPFQNLLNFSKVVYGHKEDQDESIIEFLEKLRVDPSPGKQTRPTDANHALFTIGDMREIRDYIEKYFDPKDIKAVQTRIDPALVRRDQMARKKFLLDKFRETAFRCCKRRRHRNHQGDPFSKAFARQTNVTVIPSKTTSAVYLSKVFKYAVKRTILEHKREMGGDPWDEFFYRVYSINRESMNLEFSREDVPLCEIKKPSPGSSARMAKLSDALVKGEPSRSPSPLMTAMVGRLPVAEREENAKRKRLQKIDVSPGQHPRFRFGKMPHSPDGRTSLTRLFYLPLMDRKDRFYSDG